MDVWAVNAVLSTLIILCGLGAAHSLYRLSKDMDHPMFNFLGVVVLMWTFVAVGCIWTM